ncbi:hypothetical protein E2C01_063612 [Portunus trituberculatus]|uniref:Uncharacterized protein n=1 Tax=Portunus trituberculatus TaxID=210409 RepID=A0A5B7HI33_PORTR|nr:hypothetical protein [Portunus trituberculatus]
MMTSAGNTQHNNETVTSPLASRRVPYSLLFFTLSRLGTRHCLPSVPQRDSQPRTFYLVRAVLIGKGAASCLGCRRYPGADVVVGMMIVM